jgi:arylsulfatase A
MTRFIRSAAACLAGVLLFTPAVQSADNGKPRPPNIILILADDLGYGELGCYGQKIIRTPTLDRLAKEGARFTQAYAACAVCAPSRCMLLTGKHAGHAAIRDNKEVGEWNSYEGQEPLPATEVTFAQLLKEAGYATACIGKWGLGKPGSCGDPNRHGFDLFFGYNCQRQAHNYYPAYLVRNQEQVPMPGNDGKSATGKTYAPDRMIEESLQFIRANRDRPFFLFFTTTIPHTALQVPDESVKEYATVIKDDPPYDGKEGYQPHKTPRAAYAAMITRLDHDIDRMVALLGDLGVASNTLVLFTSDNGTTHLKQVDSALFNSCGGLHGMKGDLYEGGIRVPLIAWWPEHVPGGKTMETPCASVDFFPSLCEVAGIRPPGGLDGISLLPLLQGGAVPAREYLYWEFPGYGGQQAIRLGDWKGVRRNMEKGGKTPLELYNLKTDPAEAQDMAVTHPDIVARMEEVMKQAHVPNPAFPLKPLDP